MEGTTHEQQAHINACLALALDEDEQDEAGICKGREDHGAGQGGLAPSSCDGIDVCMIGKGEGACWDVLGQAQAQAQGSRMGLSYQEQQQQQRQQQQQQQQWQQQRQQQQQDEDQQVSCKRTRVNSSYIIRMADAHTEVQMTDATAAPAPAAVCHDAAHLNASSSSPPGPLLAASFCWSAWAAELKAQACPVPREEWCVHWCIRVYLWECVFKETPLITISCQKV